MKAAVLFVCVAVGCASVASGPSTLPVVDQPTVTLPPEIDRVLRDYERAWQAHDAIALSSLFAEDGFVLSNGAPPARGRDAIRAAYSGAGGALDLRPFHYAIDGDLAFVLGAFRHGPSTPEGGKFTLVLRRGAAGRWLIAVDMDNANEWRRGS
jgi:ketosteroid isomerase-like protein